jgi:curved DNA-binding protein CbpA
MHIDEARAVLGVTAAASEEEIRRAYLDLIKVWHPDRFLGDLRLQAKATRQLQLVNVA